MLVRIVPWYGVVALVVGSAGAFWSARRAWRGKRTWTVASQRTPAYLVRGREARTQGVGLYFLAVVLLIAAGLQVWLRR